MTGGSDSGVPAAALAEVALLYYRDGLTQEQVGARLGISRATVVNYLRQARTSGVVEIRINGESFTTSHLARDLARCWGLAAAYITPETAIHANRSLVAALSRLAAAAIPDLLSSGSRIGISVGEVVQTIAEALPLRAIPGLVVHQMVGSIHETRFLSAEICAAEVARKFMGECRTLHAPAVLSTPELAAALRAEPVIRWQLGQLNHLTHALFSVGGMGMGASIVTSGLVSEEEAEAHTAEGAVALLCGHFLDAEGREMRTPLAKRVIGITPAQILRTPCRILVAGGPERRAAIRALLNGGFVTHLVTDHASARALLD